ncbi:hypothetical protein PoB_007455500 [Plakobranchus ocellatus]|uniref:Uncharacterized protein n=1 Tax=Plakobranchus ocellatus TaxID=259542 RepID=A0AAV4DVM2_9GAST|nr:hypothetical protein PoB_007455500 [Plakobranchus ocellatus]
MISGFLVSGGLDAGGGIRTQDGKRGLVDLESDNSSASRAKELGDLNQQNPTRFHVEEEEVEEKEKEEEEEWEEAWTLNVSF